MLVMIMAVSFLPAFLLTGTRAGKSIMKTFLIILGLIFVMMMVVSGLVFGGGSLLQLSSPVTWFAVSCAAAVVGTLLIGFRMHPRSLYGKDLVSRIRGFRRFLETAEKDRLKLLVEQDPQYFYNILPYAYVLGVSSKWIARFDEIAEAPPAWLQGGNDLAVMDTIERSMRSFGHDMTSEPKATFSGGSSGSGWSSSSSSDSSWSSSGSSGGGSSGGGSGGGGGSSW
jgi:uncharacterized membrane protein YgcG